MTYLADLTAMQRALLEQAVEAVYRARGITPITDLSALTGEDWPHVGDVYRYCADQSGPEWTTLTAEANFVVIDIHDLQDAPDAVKRAQYLNVLGYLWDLVRADRSEHKLLLVDEAWMLIDPRAPEALRFMKASRNAFATTAGASWS